MKQPRRNLLLAAVLAATGAMALAQSPAPTAGDASGARPGWSQRRADPERMQQRMADRHARRMTELKDALKLTPAQEEAWNQYNAAMQPPAFGQRQRQDRAELAKLTTPERIDRMQQRAEERLAQMKQRGDATKAFYAQLSPEQQQTFDSRAQRAGWGRGHGHGWRGMGPGPR